MKTRFAKVLVLLTLVIAMVAMTAIPALAANPVTVLDGQVTVSSDNATSLSKSTDGATVTVTAKGSLLGKKTADVVITNSSESPANISFDYDISKASSHSEGTVASGSKSLSLPAGATYTISFTSNSGLSNTTATLKLFNFTIEMASGESNLTVSYGSLGSATADGSAVESGTVIGVTSGASVELVATPASGAKFLGWINTTDNSIVSTSATYSCLMVKDMSVRAVFTKASEAPMFYADGTAKLFESLDAAVSYASSASNKVITLASDATLAAGNYTIPAGVTLQIPYNDAHTLTTTKPTVVDVDTIPSAYRTLDMASGANITVNGAISLSGQESGKYGANGMPVGPTSFIKMKENSNIVVNSGGSLYSWGFIIGSGAVEIKSGGTVYECFQVADFRGGDGTTQVVSKDDEYGVFPFTQYYVQNIEVPMTLHAGAVEKGFFAMKVTLLGLQSAEVPFIGTNNTMFIIDEGYVVKDYLEGTGRMEVRINGDVRMSTMSISIIGAGTVTSSKYALPITNHMNVTVESGTINIGQNIALLPGAKLRVEENASCVLGSGNKIYIYDYDEWIYTDESGAIYGHCGAANKVFVQTRYVPGKDGVVGRTEDASVEVNGTIDASAGYVYATPGGANVYSKGNGKIIMQSGTDTIVYNATQAVVNNDQKVSFVEIPIKAPVLKDADGTTVSADVAGEYKYYVATGKWDKPGHRYESTVIAPTCSAVGYTEHTCIACGDSYKDSEVAKLNHTEVTDPAVAPTCTENGKTEGSHCSVCGEIIVAQAIVEALDHEGVTDAAVEATCTTAGKTEGMHCERCGEVLIAQKEIPALGHTEVIDEGKAATCNEAGLTEGKHCETCGETLVAQSVISALGHDEVIDEGKAATCTETGLTEGKYCGRCGEVIIAQDEISALGHTEVIDEAVEATCTATGLTEGKHCSVCDEVLTAQKVIPANGHSYGEWEITKNATYTEAGSKKQTCSACSDVVTEEIPVLANPVTNWNITLKDNIGVNFVMNLAENDEVTVTVNGNPVEFTQENGKFSINVAAAQMMDEIAISVNDLPLAKTYSVRGYADKILNGDYDEAAQTLVKNMLVYGGAAQTYFGYNSENEKDLASYGIEVETVVPAGDGEVAVTDSLSAISFYGATLVHETKTAVRIYFTGSIGGLTFEANGNKVEATAKDDMYYVEVSGINPQDLDNDVTVVVTDGTNELTVAYSPLDYIVRMYNKAGTSAALVQALYGYYLAAAAYTA